MVGRIEFYHRLVDHLRRFARGKMADTRDKIVAIAA
jgi:hypothetical protein